ncbi:MAG: antibiotic biosynthesis monooxygenase [Actinobacteria bacterium]|nr:antibiotic biosynthesis monooxygenase [Actinomycetota bacterium]
MTYGLFGFVLSQEDKRDELLGYLLRAAELLEQDPGCIHYLVGTSDHPDAVWISEVWTDREAHEHSLESEEVTALIQHARPLIAGMGEQTELTIHGGKGLPRPPS